jgi:hypothetical protein
MGLRAAVGGVGIRRDALANTPAHDPRMIGG